MGKGMHSMKILLSVRKDFFVPSALDLAHRRFAAGPFQPQVGEDGGEDADEGVEEDLGAGDEAEAHAEAEQAARVSDVARLGDLLVLLEAFRVGILTGKCPDFGWS